MRIFVTGGSGFVGAHVVRVIEAHGAEVAAPRHSELDVTDARVVRDSIATFAPDAIVHCAILNDLGALYADRHAGRNAYVGATRNLVDAANEAGAPPREQDAGFGYFVAALVQRLRNGERFGVWESDRINMVATPTLASEAAELMLRILERDLDGIFHCCGGESVDRRTLAKRAVEVFELDPDLLDLEVPPPEEALTVPGAAPPPGALTARGAPPPPEALTAPSAAGRPIAIPYDTSLDATRTAAALDAELPDVTEMLRKMCSEPAPV